MEPEGETSVVPERSVPNCGFETCAKIPYFEYVAVILGGQAAAVTPPR